MRTFISKSILVAALGLVACGDDGPGDSAEEICCACVRDQACGGSSFSFGECVPDGYGGLTTLEIDASCVSSRCGEECEGARFR